MAAGDDDRPEEHIDEESGGGWVIASSPCGDNVVAIHGRWMCFFSPDKKTKVMKAGTRLSNAIRAVAFSPAFPRLYTAGDDKVVEAWDLTTSEAICQSSPAAKKIGQLLVTSDTVKGIDTLIFGDLTGDVYRMTYSVKDGFGEKEFVLGHTASTITSLTFTSGNKYLVTGDKDEHVRVSKYPNTYDIESYCLGHTAFITDVVSVGDLIVSASGDGSLRLWDPRNGEPLDILAMGGETESGPTVFSLARVSLGGKDLVFAAVDTQGIVAVEIVGKKLTRVAFDGWARTPYCLAAAAPASGDHFLWGCYVGETAPLVTCCKLTIKDGAVIGQDVPLALADLPFSAVPLSTIQLQLEKKRKLRSGEGTPSDIKRRREEKKREAPQE